MGRIKGSKVIDGKVIPPGTVPLFVNPLIAIEAEIHTLQLQIEQLRSAKNTFQKIWAKNT